jgi:uncharacterized protein (DUF1800 family)
VAEALSLGPQETLERAFLDRGDPSLHASIEPLLSAGGIESLQAWWMSLILESGAPLRERMALVWHDHFATSNDKVDDVRLMHRQNELFRASGLGDFRELLHDVARDAAMLVWLDGNSNRAEQPNENFARELLELFALGIGSYTEDDVREVARAFSGWGTEGRSSTFRAEHHDARPKTIFGHTGAWTGDDALELVLEHPACCRHVARVLLEAFVMPSPADEWVEGVAGLLLECEWSVARTLEVLLASELFFSSAARRSRIAGPVELVAATARALDARIAPRLAARMASDMGQALFRPPSVKGWDGGRHWIHSGTWIARHNALVELATAAQVGDGRVHVDLERSFGDALDALPGRALAALIPDGSSPRLEQTLASAARGARDANHARQVVAAVVLTAPEYHLY